MGKIKIFLAYHKNTPCYKSEIFQPVHVGAELSNEKLEFALPDNRGDNISELNPYYCELTGQYWVLKNYIDSCDEEYIGFAHYRRLPDIISTTTEDTPSVYGISYSRSVELFKDLNSKDLYQYLKDFDVIVPCKCYMYPQTVNPIKKEGTLDTYTHFKTMHNNNLLDTVADIIKEHYPEYSDSLKTCLTAKKSYFYNTYIMKKELMREYLNLLFDILDKTGEIFNGWENTHYYRIGGFLSEFIFSVWINKHFRLNIGHCPLYMVDFEADIIEKINNSHNLGDTENEIKELQKLLEITLNKYPVLLNITACYLSLGDYSTAKKYTDELLTISSESEHFYQIATLLSEYPDFNSQDTVKLYQKAISFKYSNKIYAQDFLKFAQNTHNPEYTKLAWEAISKFELTENELAEKERFLTIYSKISK